MFVARQSSHRIRISCCVILVSYLSLVGQASFGQTEPLVYEGDAGPGVGKHIVFLAGDHEYRGEQTCPMLARILAKHHGFKCTVLFSLDKDTGDIVPGSSFMPGTGGSPNSGSGCFLFAVSGFSGRTNATDRRLRWSAAVPSLDLRTSTHAFNIPKESPFAKFSYEFEGGDYQGGFGRQVLGETWAGHYGQNHVMSTRLDIVADQADHPVLTGVKQPWVHSGGYWADPMPGSLVLAMTQPLQNMEQDAPPVADKPPCPNCWVRTYAGREGRAGRVFTTTSGASEDILDDDFRRLLINACFWAAGMEDQIKPDNGIAMVGPYHPSTFAMNENYYVGVKPKDLAGWDSPIMPTDKPLKKR